MWLRRAVRYTDASSEAMLSRFAGAVRAQDALAVHERVAWGTSAARLEPWRHRTS